jgi:hypothetical protein
MNNCGVRQTLITVYSGGLKFEQLKIITTTAAARAEVIRVRFPNI